MRAMSTIDALVIRIEQYCRKYGIAETTFGRFSVNDGKLIARLRDGKSITLDTLQKIERSLSSAPTSHSVAAE
jgi:hypothetical protein